MCMNWKMSFRNDHLHYNSPVLQLGVCNVKIVGQVPPTRTLGVIRRACTPRQCHRHKHRTKDTDAAFLTLSRTLEEEAVVVNSFLFPRRKG